MEELTVFEKILKGDLEADVVYEDDLCLAFKDVNPQAKVHIILIPKKINGLKQLSNAQEQDKPLLGHLMWAATQVAVRMNLWDGWRLVVNDGPYGCINQFKSQIFKGQGVYYLHLHILGGEQLTWPPGTRGPGGKY